jgi:hypothetical protein
MLQRIMSWWRNRHIRRMRHQIAEPQQLILEFDPDVDW